MKSYPLSARGPRLALALFPFLLVAFFAANACDTPPATLAYLDGPPEDHDLTDADLEAEVDTPEVHLPDLEIEDSPDLTDLNEVCTPDCDGKACGDNGCGGLCGVCDSGLVCDHTFTCAEPCVPDCDDKACGDDGCGGLCGTCDGGLVCDHTFTCLEPCVPNCEGQCCGDDGCGGLCASPCGGDLHCDPISCQCTTANCAAHPALPTCGQLTHPPTTSADIATWIRDNSFPLQCDVAGARRYNFDILVRDFGDDVLFMFGEVHGTAELGHLSAALFEHLARAGIVNALTMEIGMDLTEPLRTYIATGAGPLLTEYQYSSFSRDMFLVTLVEAARRLYLEGIVVNIYGADVPMSQEWTQAAIIALANTLPAGPRATLLDALPAIPSYMWFLPLTYYNQVTTYYTNMQAEYATLCPQVGPELCEQVQALVAALWCGAFSNSEKMFTGTEAEWDLFFARREPVIAYNYRREIQSAADRTYTHMGAAHTALDATALGGTPSVAYRLHHDHLPSQGAVYATTPAWGPGSSIRYGWQLVQLPADPPVIADALGSTPEFAAYYLSTAHPSTTCQTHPLLALQAVDYDWTYSEAYAAYIYFPKVTPERQGRSATDYGMAQRILQYREAIAKAEREALLRRR